MDIPALLEAVGDEHGLDGTTHEWSVGAEYEWADETYTYNVTCTHQRALVDIVGRVRENESGDTVETVERDLHRSETSDRVRDVLSDVFDDVRREG